jgi:Zn-dependent peptidase ImmA (M78 family)
MNIDTKIDTGNEFKPNRKMRRAKVPADASAVRVLRRHDKVLAKYYGIPRAFAQHAKRYGISMEMLCSNLLQAGVIQYRELPKDPNHRIFWRKK